MAKKRIAQLNPKTIRRHIVKMAYKAQCAHLGSAFSIVEILCAIFGVMVFNPDYADRDYLVLSKGHGAMALYACLYELGYLDKKDLDNYLSCGTRLFGLCEDSIPGIDTCTGSLGQGLPYAVGVAYALKKAGKDSKVYCVVGDGELQEGSCMEAINFISEHELHNIQIVVDKNNFQAMGKTTYCGGYSPSSSANGHDVKEIRKEFFKLRFRNDAAFLIAETQKGYGLSFTVNNNEWHYRKLDQHHYYQAMAELK